LPFNWLPSERKPVYLKKNWLNGQVRRSRRSAIWNLHPNEGHSLSMLRRVAEALGATLHIELLRGKRQRRMSVAENQAGYEAK